MFKRNLTRKHFGFLPLLWIVLGMGLVCCNKTTQNGPPGLTVWAHAGQASERETIEQQLNRFNATQNAVRLRLNFIPERTYNTQVQVAALAGDLPDILELDGPYIYNYVWQGHLVALESLISPEVIQDLIPSIVDQGTYHGQLYALGTFDSGLGIYARRSALQAAGVRIPQGPQTAWSAAEMTSALASLAAHDPDRAVLDLKLNYPAEWFVYAFSPLLQSAGADLIDRKTYQSADESLTSSRAVSVMQTLQSWLINGYVDPNVDDAAFTAGRVALSWAGHWEYGRYAQAVGDDLVLLPLPDFGKGMKTAQGSWVWGITTACTHPQQAARFLEFLLQPKEILAMSDANAAVPATRSAIALSSLYRAAGPLHLFAQQLQEGYSVPRPKTPGYPVISSAFYQAFMDIRNGSPVQNALDRAAAEIDEDILDNRGYPFVPKNSK